MSRVARTYVEVWDLRPRTRVAAAPFAEIGSGMETMFGLALSPDGKILALVGSPNENVVLLRDADTLAPLDTLEQRAAVFQVTFSTDGTRIVTGSDDGAARVWNAQTGRPDLHLARSSRATC